MFRFGRRVLLKLFFGWFLLAAGQASGFILDEPLADTDTGYAFLLLIMFGGFLAGGCLAGDRIGPAGWGWLLGGVLALVLGAEIEAHLKSPFVPWSMVGLIVGAHLGLLFGVHLEQNQAARGQVRWPG
ncbi:MAG: hypothetical protein AB7K24_03835 [Gemmataceae bacterium]